MYIPLVFKKILFTIHYSNYIVVKLIIVDQLVKWFFINYLKSKVGLTLQVTSFCDLVYSWNYGISFGIFQNYYQCSNMLFIVVNSVIAAYLWCVLLRCKTTLNFIGYSFLVGGAIGNLIDRFVNGAVFDFIYFHYQNFSFPVFNLADTFISLGTMFLLYDYYKTKKIVEQKEKVKYNDVTV